MPVKPKRRKRLAIDVETILADRWGWRIELDMGDKAVFGSGSNGDTELLRQVWETVRDIYLPQFIAANPGHRPFAWWLFEHKQERPIDRKWPGFVREAWARHGFLHTHLSVGPEFSPMQEPEEGYLRRNGLLTDDELDALQMK